MSNMLKTTVFLALLTGLFIAVGGLLGGRSGMVMAFVFALVMNFVSYWFSDKIVLKMYGAQPIGEAEAPVVHRIVRTLATKAGIPMPKLYLIPSESPNAFATGRNPQHAAVAVTSGIMRIMDDEGARGGARPRAVARPQPGHPDLDGRGDRRRRHLDARQHGPVGA